MADLRPVLWGDEQDLLEACKWVIEKVQRHGLTVMLQDDGQPKPLDKEVLIATYQSIQELLTNVVKHARTTRATLEILRSESYVEAIVTDEGIGFDPMAPRTVSRESGFGLFSIRERIPLLGGSFDTISSPSKGTVATIRVPLKCSANTVEPREVGTPAIFPKGTNVPLYRILLADDHRIMREGLRTMLEGYEDFAVVAEAADGGSAVKQTILSRPDVILMDVNMPIVNGVDATRLIKDKFPDVLIIGLSLYEDDKTIAAMRDAGASACFSKAESMENVYAAIRNLPPALTSPRG
ncbi:ATP-binding response regulator [Nitrospira sp. Nam74]